MFSSLSTRLKPCFKLSSASIHNQNSHISLDFLKKKQNKKQQKQQTTIKSG